MGSFGKVALVIVLAILAIGGTFLGMSIHYKSSEVNVRNTITEHQKTNEASRDTMFNILKNKVGLADKDREDFKEFWPQLAGKQFENDKNLLMKWIQVKNPKWDNSLYKDLMVSVEAERHRFLNDQKELARLKKVHDNLIDGPVSGFFLAGCQKIDVVIVTSSGSQEVFRTGTDDEDPLARPKKEAQKGK